MKATYDYSRPVEAEVAHMLALALAAFGRMTQATLQEDFRGTDFHYMLGDLPLAVRARFDRGHHWHGADVTFRVTEPAKIARREYAPLFMTVWFENGLAEYGYLVDVYAMVGAMDRARIIPFDRRPVITNPDGTKFQSVDRFELLTSKSLIATGDRFAWLRQPDVVVDRVTKIAVKTARAAQVTIDWNDETVGDEPER